MLPRYCFKLVLAVLLFILFVAAVGADEAVLRNGRRLAGKLQLDADGRLRFVSKESMSDVPIGEIHDIRFPDAVVHVALWGAPVRLEFGMSEWITGELVELTEKSATVRTFWSEKASLPRVELRAVTQPTGWLTFFHEDFEAEKCRLRLTNSPKLDAAEHTSGSRSLRLDAAGQSAEYVLAQPLEAGRFGVNFREVDKTASGRWYVEADFGHKNLVRVEIGGEAEYAVQTEIPAAESRQQSRSPGWHRLSIRFRRAHLLIGIDNKLLFESAEARHSKGLRAVRLGSKADPKNDTMHGAVCFDDFSIARPVEELRDLRGDPSQDECRLAEGDQLFGRITHADGRTVELQGGFGKRKIPWTMLRGVFLKKADAADPKTGDGVHVRLWLDSGYPDADELRGVLLKLDADKLVLRHAVFGDLTLDRTRLRKLRPLLPGKRIE
jgi:hypothetical protein